MANYKGHTVGALVAGGAYVAALTSLPGEWTWQTAGLLASWQMVVAVFVVSVLFGLWPDVDTNSKAQNLFFSVAFVADIALVAIGRFEVAAYLGLVAMTPIVGKHRGWTHSKLAIFLVPLPIVVLPYIYRPDYFTFGLLFYGAAVCGYFSHLMLDGLIFRKFKIKGGW